MKDYKKAVGYIRKFLLDNHYCHTLVQANERCFRKLEAYLKLEETDYTPAKADEWFRIYADQLAASDRKHCKVALLRLRDMYEYGEIQPEHDTRHLMSYTILADELRNSLDLFLLNLSGKLSPDTVDNYKHSCARFLGFMQKSGIHQVREITFELLCTFYQSDVHDGKWGKAHVNAHVSAMMGFFFERGDVPYGFSVIFHYLSHGKGCYWNQVSPEAHQKIKTIVFSTETISTEKLRKYKEMSNQLHSDLEYSKTIKSANNRAVDLLILFLEMNGYRYHPEIAILWFEEIRPYFKSESSTIRRALCMAADHYHTSELHLETVYRKKPRAFDLLPEWCHEPAGRYVILASKKICQIIMLQFRPAYLWL